MMEIHAKSRKRQGKSKWPCHGENSAWPAESAWGPLALPRNPPIMGAHPCPPDMVATLTDRYPLRPGSHSSREDGLCAMEMVAWLAGEEHSDEPACACPILSAYARCMNDLLPDNEARRKHLRPMVPRMVNSNLGEATATARAFLAADCTARFLAALQLARLSRIDAGQQLRLLPEIKDRVGATIALGELRRVGPELRGAIWTLQQAAAGRPARLWVSGAVHAAKATNSWHLARRLLGDMIAVGQVKAKKS